MTAVELFEKITSEPKWYAGYCEPSNASNIKKRFKNNKLNFNKLQHLFNHFGYYLEAEWIKKGESLVNEGNTVCSHEFGACDEMGRFPINGNEPHTPMFAKCIKCGYRP